MVLSLFFTFSGESMYSKVYVEISNICNMNCSFCHGHSRAPRKMSMEEFSFILDQLTDHTKYLYYHLMGEPLIHPQLPDFIKMAGERGYKSIITTNGTLLHARCDELLSAGIHKVNISMHSFEEDDPEGYAKYIRNLAGFAKKAASAGVIVVFRLWNQGFDHGKNELALELLKQNISGDWAKNNRGLRIRSKMFIELDERFEWPDSEADVKGTRFYCYGLKDQFGILADGTVVPCCLDSEGIINLGNIFRDDIHDILHSKRAVDMVEGFRCGRATEDLCKRCGYAQRFVR